MNINKVLLVKCSDKKDFFAHWVSYINPNLGLTAREQEVLASILRTRYELSKSIINQDTLDEICLNAENRAKISEYVGMSPQQFGVIVYKLKDMKILQPHFKDNGRTDYYKINPTLIPNYTEGEDFKFMIVFR